MLIEASALANESGLRAGWRPLSEQVLPPPSFLLGGRK
jgi:hypothetical protein